MDKETKETVLQAVDYTNTEAQRYHKRVRLCNGIALLLVLIYSLIKDTDLYNNPTVMIGMDILQGIAVGMLLIGLLFSSRYGAKVRAFKHRLISEQNKIREKVFMIIADNIESELSDSVSDDFGVIYDSLVL